jgi:hypothetical protein
MMKKYQVVFEAGSEVIECETYGVTPDGVLVLEADKKAVALFARGVWKYIKEA